MTVYYQDQFRVTPTNPPSAVVNMRGGWLYLDGQHADVGQAQYISATVCDFAGTIGNYTGIFTNANRYLGVILCLHNNAWTNTAPIFWTISTAIERATAVEAEQDITAMFTGTTDVYSTWMPLRAVILRNNGIISGSGAVLPIDGVNRGRSYLWRDCRPRHRLML
jgi:hypothetical protein